MVNSIGMLSRNLGAYVSAHQQSPDLHKHSQHRPVEQLKEVDEWRLSELGFVAAMMEKAAQANREVAKGSDGLDDKITDLTKGILRCEYNCDYMYQYRGWLIVYFDYSAI